ncbi:MAG: hypothetical protein KF872_00340 [Chitinophagales bacterium]|nr:hypothetical protein [Chitinophagales bacterium]
MSQKLKLSLIERYRETIHARYQFSQIKDNKNLPDFFTQEKADELRNFFLQNLYPDINKRQELDAAFARLESYVNDPAKIWGILGNLTAAIFRFGILFPKAIKAGIETLHTHTAARNFEELLLQTALKQNLTAPVTEAQLLQCIADLPQKKIQQFIDELCNLFLIITDTKMLEKTIGILEDVATRMKANTKTYDKNDVQAILLGANILKMGKELMQQYNDHEKKAIVEFIAQTETKFINNIKSSTTKNRKKTS